MQEPTAAGGRERAIILTDSASWGAPPASPVITRASPKEANEKTVDSTKANPRESAMMRLIFLLPAPSYSETKRLVEIKIFPLASTMIKLKSEKIRVITPTEAVPSLFDTRMLRNSPNPCKTNETIVSLAVSFAIRFIKIFNGNPSFLSYIYENP